MKLDSRIKYPRSVRGPTSPGFTADDLRAKDGLYAHFEGREAVISAKMDGESTTMAGGSGPDEGYIHARSVDAYNTGPAAHTRDWMRRFWSHLRYNLPAGYRFCGENCYAKHAIFYPNLPSYFFLYSIWDENNHALSWDDTEQWAQMLGIYTVPIIWCGVFDRKVVENMMPVEPLFGEQEAEGFIVRLADSFTYEDFQKSLFKHVRSNHVAEGSAHWAHEKLTPNSLAENATPWPGFRA